jgi:hypothetical protein
LFFFNHTFYILIPNFNHCVESTEVLIYCAIVYRGGLALKSILLNKRHIHTYYQFSQPTLDEKLKNNPKIGILLVYFEGEKKKKKKKKSFN